MKVSIARFNTTSHTLLCCDWSQKIQSFWITSSFLELDDPIWWKCHQFPSCLSTADLFVRNLSDNVFLNAHCFARCSEKIWGTFEVLSCLSFSFQATWVQNQSYFVYLCADFQGKQIMQLRRNSLQIWQINSIHRFGKTWMGISYAGVILFQGASESRRFGIGRWV